MTSDMAQLFGETSMVITLQPDEDRSIYDGAELFTSGDSLGVHMKPQYRIGPEIAPGQPGQGMDFAEVFLGLGYLTQRIIRILGRYLRD